MTKADCKRAALDQLNKQINNIENNFFGGLINYTQYSNQLISVNNQFAQASNSCDNLAFTIACKQAALNEMNLAMTQLNESTAAGTAQYETLRKAIIARYNSKYRACKTQFATSVKVQQPTDMLETTIINNQAAPIMPLPNGRFTYTDNNGQTVTTNIRTKNIRGTIPPNTSSNNSAS